MIKLIGLGGYISFPLRLPHFSRRNCRFYWYSSSFFNTLPVFPLPSVFPGKSISFLASRSAQILHIQRVHKCTNKFAPAPAPAAPAVPAAPAAPTAKNIQCFPQIPSTVPFFSVFFRFIRYNYRFILFASKFCGTTSIFLGSLPFILVDQICTPEYRQVLACLEGE